MNKSLHYLLTLTALLFAFSLSAGELTNGSLTLETPDGEMTFELPQSGYAVQDFTSMGAADVLVVKTFSVTATGNVSNVLLKAAVYPESQQQPENWMEFPLNDNGDGTWSVELNADFVENFGAGTFTLEFYAQATDSDNSAQLTLNNGGQNYKVKFTLKKKEEKVAWLDTGAAQIWLDTSEGMQEYRYNGDGTRDNETMPGSTDYLSVNYFNMYYNLADGVTIVDASLQYMIYPEGESGGNWNTITCNETSTLVSSRKNTYRSSFNTARLLTEGLAAGNYTMRVMFQLIDNEGKYYFLGKDNDNFLFHFSINEPVDPKLIGISMTITPTPGEQQFLWIDEGEDAEPFVPITLEEPLQSCSVDEVFIFYEGTPSNVKLCCVVKDEEGMPLYRRDISTPLNAWGSASTEEPTQLIEPSALTPGNSYTLLLWAEATAPDGSTIYLNNNGNEGDGYEVLYFVYGGSQGVYGDVNGDGEVTVGDVSAIYNIILGQSEEFKDAADVNRDGEVTVGDVSAIYNIILGLD